MSERLHMELPFLLSHVQRHLGEPDRWDLGVILLTLGERVAQDEAAHAVGLLHGVRDGRRRPLQRPTEHELLQPGLFEDRLEVTDP